MVQVPPEGCVVYYTWNQERAKAIFLTRDKAEDYIIRMKLSDAIIYPLYRLSQITVQDLDENPQVKVVEKK